VHLEKKQKRNKTTSDVRSLVGGGQVEGAIVAISDSDSERVRQWKRKHLKPMLRNGGGAICSQTPQPKKGGYKKLRTRIKTLLTETLEPETKEDRRSGGTHFAIMQDRFSPQRN